MKTVQRDRLRDHFDAAIMQTYAKTMLRGYKVPGDLYGPFVPYVFDEYSASTVKLIIVGQQTWGWQPFKEALEKRMLFPELQDYTKGFKLGEQYRATPFWDFAHKLNARLNPGNPLGFVWTNLAKLEQENDLPGDPFMQFVKTEFCLMFREIEVLEADAVVFLTGPDYDELLFGQVYLNAKIDPLPLVPIEGFDARHFAKLANTPYKAFRCAHPKYLRLKGTFDATMDKLTEEIGGR